MAEPSTVGDDLAKLNVGEVPDVCIIDLMFPRPISYCISDASLL